ncbi:MAG: hypothetical protein CL878_14730 [Dehalococcoidia bacterium]|nr:hypothetical protein [Dehalococcoidia bacterium]
MTATGVPTALPRPHVREAVPVPQSSREPILAEHGHRLNVQRRHLTQEQKLALITDQHGVDVTKAGDVLHLVADDVTCVKSSGASTQVEEG